MDKNEGWQQFLGYEDTWKASALQTMENIEVL